ncbi:MAG: MoxR family ATPase [Ignavibacteriales bacterium]|nr:MoxR family ATPase [Ignavibacteriales bacterium]
MNIKIVQALDKVRLSNLFVHNAELSGVKFTTESLKSRKVYLVETLAVVNALVDRGTMLLSGGHGGGKTTLAKYLGQIFYKLSTDEIEDCILRGHPQLTEEKILGSLDIAQLTGARKLNDLNQVDVVWNDFVDAPWKIIDELNRLSPYAQNILLSLLAESSVKYHNESKRLPAFSLYATMNPKDEGNFTMSLPFLDRFAIALPITMPDYDSLATIGKLEKSSRQDRLSSYLEDFDLLTVQEEIKDTKYSEEAELFINVIIAAYRLCDRISKESNESTNVDKGLCYGCHYNAPEKVCNKIIHPLSVRVKEDLYRYGKALAWYLGENEVKISHIQSLAPYLIWHRSSISKVFKRELRDSRFGNDAFTLNIDLNATEEIIKKIANEFDGLKVFLKEYDKVRKGRLEEIDFQNLLKEMESPNNNFLVLKKEIIPILKNLYKPVYDDIRKYNEKINAAKNMEELNNLKSELSARYDIPNRGYLADLIDVKKKMIGNKKFPEKIYKLPFEGFEELVLKSDELHKLIKSKFYDNFNPAIRKEEILANIEDSDIELKLEKQSAGGGKYMLKFKYKGPADHPVNVFLEQCNENKL